MRLGYNNIKAVFITSIAASFSYKSAFVETTLYINENFGMILFLLVTQQIATASGLAMIDTRE